MSTGVYDSREEELEDIAQEYVEQGYSLVALDEGYPGIFEDPVPDHELQGRADILLSYPDSDDLKLVEAGRVSTLNPEWIEDKYLENAEQLSKGMNYFEERGYNVDPELRVRASGNLRMVKEIWNNTTCVFSWPELVDSVSEPDRLSELKDKDIIIFDSLSKTQTELYTVDLDEEMEEIIEMFRNDLV
ncbi:MAG: hypothetical protein ABEJ99_05345 [Candidatus Nanohaloarchaea archaeon]